MSRSGANGGRRAAGRGSFLLYVEGPRDREILQRWAHADNPRLGRALAEAAVILGGRRPARAVEHFRERGGSQRGGRALCILDRDGGAHSESLPSVPGLEFYTWRRRHIESYLLVPEAIRRTLRLRSTDTRVERLFREHLPPAGDEQALVEVDAKRLLDSKGPLARGLGRELVPGRIARAMRPAEVHPEVAELLQTLRERLGLVDSEPRVVERTR